MANTKSVTDVDARISANLRRIRVVRGLTQEAVGEKIGVTFQQLQKYEKGTNRISAGKLVALAKVLECDVMSFFEGVERNDDLPPVQSKGAIRSAQLFDRMANDRQRAAVLRLMESLVEDSHAQDAA